MRHRSVVGLSLVLISVVAIAAPAGAAKATEQHCATRLVPIGPGSEPGAIATEPEELGCYETFEAALSVGLGTSVDLEDDVTAATLTEATLDASVTSSGDVLIGTEYTQVNYVGDSKSYFAPVGCNAGPIEVSYVGNNWNDLFDAGKGFGACNRNRKFAASNFGGASLLCTPNCSNYGTLNNEVSSLRWRN